MAYGRLRGWRGLGLAMVVMMFAAGPWMAGADAGEPESPPWPAEVEGHAEPEPGEHPRLLFRRDDLPALRQRAQTPEGQAILKRLRELLDGEDGRAMPERYNPNRGRQGRDGAASPVSDADDGEAFTFSHAVGYGLLWQLTEDEQYAELGRKSVELMLEGQRDRDNRYSFRDPLGALRAGPSLGMMALAYDLLYDSWDDDFREKVTRAIERYNEGGSSELSALVRGARHNPRSNHWGMQVGGGALALLAIRHNPEVADPDRIENLIESSKRSMKRNMTEGFGSGGYFAEGDGTGIMSSHIIFLTALQAWQCSAGQDFISPRPHAQWLSLRWILLTIPQGEDMGNLRSGFPERGGYPHNIWARSGISGAAKFAIGYGALPEEPRAGLWWYYNHYIRDWDEANSTPFDTTAAYPHYTVFAFVNTPLDLEPVYPGEVMPQYVHDDRWGFFAFRNRWQDEDDIVISQLTRRTQAYMPHGPERNLTIWHHGKRERWGWVPRQHEHFEPMADGSAIIGRPDNWLGIDFSGASGAAGMLVMAGDNVPAENRRELDGLTYSFRFLTDENTTAPDPRVEGDRIVIGEQAVWFEDGRLRLQETAGPWEGPAPLYRIEVADFVWAGRSHEVRLEGQAVARLPDEIELALRYRPVGTESFDAVMMDRTLEDAFTADLPGEATHEALELYIEGHAGDEKLLRRPTGGHMIEVLPDHEPPDAIEALREQEVEHYRVALMWAPASDDTGIATYRVYRGGEPGEGPLLEKVSPRAEELRFADTDPPRGQEVVYTVVAVDMVGRRSEPASIRVAVPENRPPRNDLTLEAAPAARSARLRWSGQVEPDVDAIELLRAEGADGQFELIETFDIGEVDRMVDEGLEAGADYRYALRLRDDEGLRSERGEPVAVRPLRFAKRINCAGEEVDAPTGFWAGERVRLPGTALWSTREPIDDAGPLEPVYQTERWSNRAVDYALEVEPGHYEVRLHFAEINPQFFREGARVFDVQVKGEVVHEQLDVYAAAGGERRPFVIEHRVQVEDNELSIRLEPHRAGPAIKGIEVLAAD